MFDPFGFHNSMMRNFMLDPFGQQQQQQPQQQQQNRNGGGGGNSQQLALRSDPFGMMAASPFERHHQMMMRSDPFAMMNSMMMGNMMGGGLFRNMGDPMSMSSDPNSQVYSSSSVISYSNTGDGKPKIYQESKQVRHGPGGVKETREMVRDTTKGIEKVAIGHHIGERAHIIERQKQLNDGAMEEIVNLENLDEEEVNEFNKEFETRIGPSHARSFNSSHHHHNHHNHPHRSLHLNNNHPLAIEGSAAKKERKSKSKSSKN